MKKYLLLLLTTLLPLLASAFDIAVKNADGVTIYYNLSGDEATVTYRTINIADYSGSVVIPASVTYNGTTYSVTSIGSSAFQKCSSLTSVTIPESVTIIGNTAFSGCSGLTSVTIPSSVTSIGKQAFQGCSGLTSVTIPEGVTSIGWLAFYCCTNLSSITIPEGVTYIGSGAFQETAWYDNLPDGLVYAGKVVYKYKGTMPEGTEIILEEGTLGIAGNAFDNCYSLTSITIPEGVTYIGDSAFYGCYNLASVTIPNSVTSIEGSAFWGCSGLTSIIIPNSVTSIGIQAFYGCTNLISITIGSGVTSINFLAFSETGWYNAQPDGILYLDNWLIGHKGTKPTGNVTINSGTRGIADGAFDGCSGLTSITIPSSVTSIGELAFYNCSSLTSIIIPDGVTSISGSAFSGCTSLTSVTIPESVTSIGNEAFSGCSSLTSVTIGSGVTSIGENAFCECTSLTSITIPESVTSIGYQAFCDCYSLTDVWCYAESVPSTNNNAFFNSSISSATLHVPAGSVEAYRTTAPWSEFRKIEAIKATYTLTYYVDGEVYKTYEVIEGTAITPEPAPTKEGYTFSGWSEIPETMPAHDVTVTGSFTINNYTLTYFVDGQVYKTYTVSYGSTITPEPTPTKEGYTFSGWTYIPPTMPASDVVVMGSFTINSYTLTYKVDGQVYKTCTYEYGAAITPEPEPTKEGYIFSGWSEIPETMPAHNVTVTGTFTKIILTCATPTIIYANGKLTFTCETEGAVCHSTITDTDIKSYSGNEVDLTVTYYISVYATKDDYEDSEVATGTLCWIDQQPSTEGIVAEDAVTEVKALPVLIQSNGGTITIQGANEGTEISVYSVNGMKQGSAIATNGFATINTSLQPGSTAIVKIGEKAIKVLVK